MKTVFMMTVMSLFFGLSAHASFVCDYNYTAQGQNIQSTLQMEKMKGKDLLTMRAGGELISAFQVSAIQKTQIGSIVHFFMSAEGMKIEGQLVLPKILPGPGQIVWGEDGSDSVSCRKLITN